MMEKPHIPPQLLLLPGLLNTGDLFRDQIAALAGRARCLTGDITREGSLRALAEHHLEMTDVRFALAGFSLGGYVAIEMVRLAPERILGLALLDTSIRTPSREHNAQRADLISSATAPGRFHGFGNRLLKNYLHPKNQNNAVMQFRIQEMTASLSPEVFVRQSRLERPDGEEVLRGFNGPTLILCGDADQITSPESHRDMSRLAPHAKLIIIPDSGHMTPIEQPAFVSEALGAWLDEIAQSATAR